LANQQDKIAVCCQLQAYLYKKFLLSYLFHAIVFKKLTILEASNVSGSWEAWNIPSVWWWPKDLCW